MLKKQSIFSFSGIFVVFQKEFASYFNTPIGYIFLSVFVAFMTFCFFSLGLFWGQGVASMDSFFQFIRISYIFFVAAITMRLWSEEKKSGTIEVLLTFSFRDSEVIIGKFLSAVVFLALGLLGTFFIPFTIMLFGEPDLSLIIGGYVGALLLGAAYISLGLWISWLTKDQIVSFMVSLVVFFILFVMGYPPFLRIVGSTMTPFFEFLSTSSHFDALSKGILDIRDIIYFISFTSLMLFLNYRSIQKSR